MKRNIGERAMGGTLGTEKLTMPRTQRNIMRGIHCEMRGFPVDMAESECRVNQERRSTKGKSESRQGKERKETTGARDGPPAFLCYMIVHLQHPDSRSSSISISIFCASDDGRVTRICGTGEGTGAGYWENGAGDSDRGLLGLRTRCDIGDVGADNLSGSDGWWSSIS